MAEHTPAPWKHIKHSGSIQVGTKYFIASTRPEDYPLSFEDARLIAAAPDTAQERDQLKKINAELLEALEYAEAILLRSPMVHTNANGLLNPGTSTRHALGKARAAIAKAKGEAS